MLPSELAVPPGPVSHVVVANGFVYIAGQVPFTREGKLATAEFDGQVRQVFVNLGHCLNSVGCSFSDVVKVNGYLTNLEFAHRYNAIYESFFSSPYPARTTIQAGLLGFDIEVEAIALRPPE